MRCECCHELMMGGNIRSVLDDSGSLAITAWRCSGCGRITEEIHILSPHKNRARRIRYAVAAPGRLG